MVGPERRRYATKAARMIEAAHQAEADGFASVWIPQIPDELDAMTAAALIGSATSRVEVGTSVVVARTRHPVALSPAPARGQPPSAPPRLLSLPSLPNKEAVSGPEAPLPDTGRVLGADHPDTLVFREDLRRVGGFD